jgi:hypothetical protein
LKKLALYKQIREDIIQKIKPGLHARVFLYQIKRHSYTNGARCELKSSATALYFHIIFQPICFHHRVDMSNEARDLFQLFVYCGSTQCG